MDRNWKLSYMVSDLPMKRHRKCQPKREDSFQILVLYDCLIWLLFVTMEACHKTSGIYNCRNVYWARRQFISIKAVVGHILVLVTSVDRMRLLIYSIQQPNLFSPPLYYSYPHAPVYVSFLPYLLHFVVYELCLKWGIEVKYRK